MPTLIAAGLLRRSNDNAAQGSIYWDHPDLEQGYAVRLYPTGTVVSDWQLYIDLEIRKDSAVVTSQTVTTGIGAASTVSSGLFANTPEWQWSVDWIGIAEEWLRVRWSAPGEDDVYGYYNDDSNVLQPRDERMFSFFREIVGNRVVYLPLVLKVNE